MGVKHSMNRFTTLSCYPRSLVGLALLLVASYLGTFTRWTLFFDIDFIFGSIAVWLVVALYGWRWGILAGGLNALATYFLWSNPATLFVFLGEACCVGWGFYHFPDRTKRDLVLLNSLYWLLLGIPLIWLSYTLVLHLDPQQTQIIALKQSINGIANALIANLLLMGLPMHRWVGRPQAIRTISFQQTLFNLLVAFVLFPTLGLTLLSSRGVVADVRNVADSDLNQISIEAVIAIRHWYQQRLNANYALARTLNTVGDPSPVALQSYLDFTENLYPDLMGVALLDAAANPIATSRHWGQLSNLNQSQHPAFEIARTILEPVAIQPAWDTDTPPRLGLVVPIAQGVKVQDFVINELSLDEVAYLLNANPGIDRISLTLVGRDRTILASTHPNRFPGQIFNQYDTGDRVKIGQMTYQWFPAKGSQVAFIRWINSQFIQEQAIIPGLSWTLIAEKSAAANTRVIQRIYTHNLALIFGITLLALLLSIVLSRWLVQPLFQLAIATTNLPQRLAEREPIHWIQSQITEVASLINNFQVMALTLAQQFQEVQQALDYEARLKRITDNVRDSLEEGHILQTVVQELGQGLGLMGCDASLYDSGQTIATLQYEYQTALPTAVGQSLRLPGALAAIYATLFRGEPCQFSLTVPHPWRPQLPKAVILVCPIRDDQTFLGDLWLYKPQPQGFTPPEVRLVQQVATQCAIAIRQARLYHAAQAQVRALEELNQLKDDFLSTVSHELRTPITNIKLAIQMLKLAPQAPQHERYLTILQAECDREANLINDLLDLQRLTAGQQPLNLELICLQTWMLDLVATFQARALMHQQDFQVDLPASLPMIVSDPTCLSRIVSELLNNACKYTPPGEHICLSAQLSDAGVARSPVSLAPVGPSPPVPRALGEHPDPEATCRAVALTVSPPGRDRCLVLRVTNSGVEIPSEAQAQIFEKFYRIQRLDRWNQGGTGLGLALVQKLTEHLVGTIQLTSHNNYTCFTVWLPLNPPHDEQDGGTGASRESEIQ